jgi:hypothetical protein
MPISQVYRNDDPPDSFDQEEPINNPKHDRAVNEDKAPMHLIPWGVMEDVARVLQSGADKYGERNWRIDPIKCSTYEASTARHVLLQWATGEDLDKDSGLHHLAHAVAGLLIVLDAQRHGTLIDDRNRKESIYEG